MFLWSKTRTRHCNIFQCGSFLLFKRSCYYRHRKGCFWNEIKDVQLAPLMCVLCSAVGLGSMWPWTHQHLHFWWCRGKRVRSYTKHSKMWRDTLTSVLIAESRRHNRFSAFRRHWFICWFTNTDLSCYKSSPGLFSFPLVESSMSLFNNFGKQTTFSQDVDSGSDGFRIPTPELQILMIQFPFVSWISSDQESFKNLSWIDFFKVPRNHWNAEDI